jgi:hypothetical protein
LAVDMGMPPFPPRCQAGLCQEAATAGSKSDDLVGTGELEASWPQEVMTFSAGWFATGRVCWHSCSSFLSAAPPRPLVPRTGLRSPRPHRRSRRLRRPGPLRSNLWPPPRRRYLRLRRLRRLRPRRLAPPYLGPRLGSHRRPLHSPARERCCKREQTSSRQSTLLRRGPPSACRPGCIG